ncbi:DUF4375 domain-containing protein [Pseudomonas sp. F1_0610]|uniref:DMP19 family protein n=1 Tax=Pseudomonas sp. F1_0610 TaxID=3114284 RepID=UPI0039C054EA
MMEKEQQQAQAFEDYSFQVVEQLFTKYDGKLEQMPDKLQEIVLIWRVEADMYNGGFLQFFCNWGYDNYCATIKLLERLALKHAHAILQECEQLISPVQHDERVTSYQDIYTYLPEYLSETQLARLDELDALYWGDPDQIQLLCYKVYMQ